MYTRRIKDDSWSKRSKKSKAKVMETLKALYSTENVVYPDKDVTHATCANGAEKRPHSN